MMLTRFSRPVAAKMALLKRRTPSLAIFAPLGCGLQTIVFPAATMLTKLPASVGSECVTGVIAPDDAERSVLGNHQTIGTADRFGPEELNTWHILDGLKFGNLVLKPTDLRFFELKPTEFVSLFIADLLHNVDRFFTIIQGRAAEFFKTLLSGLNGFIDGVEYSPSSIRTC